ncbi:MAG: drug/metabolite transporter (DMT)-like permease, partial [Acidimicrobiales bacterium]
VDWSSTTRSPPGPPGGHPTPASRSSLDSRAPGLTLAGIILIWGLGPPISKLITAPPLVIAATRFWASVPILFAVTYATGHRVSKETLKLTWLAGGLFGMNMVFVFISLQHASVAVLSVLMALQPGVVLVVAGRWLGEKAGPWHIGWTIVGIAGVCVVVLGNGPDVRIEPLGLFGGVVSLLSFTGYYLRNRQVRSTTDIHPLEWMSGSTLFSALFVTPFALVFTDPSDFGQLGGVDWIYLFYVAGVVGIFSHTLMSWVQKFIPASRSSLYLLGMTVVAVVAAWPINGERFTAQQVFGGLIVLGAVAAVVSRPPEMT